MNDNQIERESKPHIVNQPHFKKVLTDYSDAYYDYSWDEAKDAEWANGWEALGNELEDKSDEDERGRT